MKKLLMSFAMGVLCINSQAQFNNTFSLAGLSVTPGSIARIPPASGGGTYFAGTVGGINYSYQDSFAIVKLNSLNNFQSGIMYNFQVIHHTITNTSDNGLLLAATGRVGTPGTFGPYALNIVKYNAALTPMWTRAVLIPVPGSTFAAMGSLIDIEKTTNSSGLEEYYIVNSDGGATGNFRTMLTRVSNTGTVIWSNRYLPSISPDSFGVDNPTSLTSYRDPATGALRIVIAGTNDYQPLVGPAIHRLFYMTVADNGNVITPYTLMATLNGPEVWSPDVLYDGQNIVTTYLQEDNGSIPPGTMPSLIGFIKTNLTFAPIASNLRWTSCENYGLSITLASDNNYIIGGVSGPCVPPPGSREAVNPFFMKVNRTTLAPMFMKRYNKNRSGLRVSRHITDATGNSFITYPVNVNPLQWDSRVLSVDALGSSCGEFVPDLYTYQFTPTTTTRSFVRTSVLTPAGLTLSPIPFGMTQTACSSATNPDNYRQANTGIDEIQVGEIKLFPTLLNSDRDQVTCKMFVVDDQIVDVVIFNMQGQKLQEQKQILKAGINTFYLKNGFMPGINIVRLSVNGDIVKTEKIVMPD